MTLCSNKSPPLNGFFFGVVEDNVDKEHPGSGRIKVRIEALHGKKDKIGASIPTNDLPYAGRLSFPGFGTKAGQGEFCVPTIGSIVAVMFHAGNEANPFYFASPTIISQEVLQGQDSNTSVHIDPIGNTYKSLITDLANKKGTVEITLMSELTINLKGQESGATLVVDKDLNITVTGNTSITTQGTTNISSSGATTLQSSADITIDAGGAVNITSGSDVSVSAGGNVTVTGSQIALN